MGVFSQPRDHISIEHLNVSSPTSPYMAEICAVLSFHQMSCFNFNGYLGSDYIKIIVQSYSFTILLTYIYSY